MKSHLVKTIYLYVVSVIGVIMIATGVIGLVNTTVKLIVFDKYPVPYYTDFVKEPAVTGAKDERTAEQKAQDELKAEERRDQTRKEQMVNDLTDGIALTVVGSVLYTYHWRLARKEA
jgi:hypothetical protein